MKGYTLKFLESTYAICKLPSNSQIPSWVKGNNLLGLIRTQQEMTLVCDEKYVPDSITKDGGWCAFYIDAVLGFDLVGVLASILNPLADAEISIFALSSYSTDYVLIRQDKLKLAKKVLNDGGFHILMYG